MGSERDYYADLELPPTADIQEIKKQFRKLALKYHPDRNPGKEQEVNSRFQIIQSAHEVLSDPDSKAKYDATRTRSRYPTASGVKGNPWSGAGSQFPPPPRRNQPNRPHPPPPQPSGAKRWQNRFSSGVPPTARQGMSSDAQSNARAFEHMRKAPPKPYQQESRPTPPPPPPRTESARQRAEASFGARKAGYQPRSGATGDEPPVASNNYTSRPDPERYAYSTPKPQKPHPTMPDPLSQFREREGSIDARQRTPYAAHGGEKLNPFDGIPLDRTKSTREASRQENTHSSDDTPSVRQRSASVPQDNGGPTTPKSRGQAQQPSTTGRPQDARPKAPLKKTRAVPPLNVGSNANAPSAPNGPAPEAPHQPANETSDKSKPQTAGGPSMYDAPFCSKYHQPSFCYTPYDAPSTQQPRSTRAAFHSRDAASRETSNRNLSPSKTPSGDCSSHPHLSPFEWQQRIFLAHLINNMNVGVTPTKRGSRKHLNLKDPVISNTANHDGPTSFNLNMNGDESASRSSPDMHQFMRRSTDHINTSFANDDNPTSWQFNAGGGEDAHPTSRSQSGVRSRHHSPSKRPPPSRTETPEPRSESGVSDGAFNPDGWTDQFGPQTFVPQRSQTNSASPTKSNRANIKKPRAAKVAPENSNAANDGSSDEEPFAWRGRKSQAQPAAAPSPQAMDIDSPPAETAKASAQRAASPSPKTYEARPFYVKPSNPAWQDDSSSDDGKVNGDTKKPATASLNETRAEEAKAADMKPPEPVPTEPAKDPFNPNHVGSEDSEEFRASLADLKNVAPFAQKASGLKSFADMKDNLPFESKAAPNIQKPMPKPPPLAFPPVPAAPLLPSTVFINGLKPTNASWDKYVKDFEAYLQQWDAFNGQVVDHFATRKSLVSRSRAANGYGFLEARGDTDFLQYSIWVDQDIEVQRRWVKACEEHQERLREFMAFKQKMK